MLGMESVKWNWITRVWFDYALQVPDSGKKKLCGKCAESGRQSKLRLYQIHINEAILMCEHAEVPCAVLLSFSRSLPTLFISVSLE